MDSPHKLNLKAVLVGWLTDVIGTQIVGGIIGLVAGVVLTMQGSQPEQLMERLTNSTGLHIVGFCVGLLLTVAGGFVAAHIARGAEMKHALAVGVLSLLTGIISLRLMPNTSPGWYLPAALLRGDDAPTAASSPPLPPP